MPPPNPGFTVATRVRGGKPIEDRLIGGLAGLAERYRSALGLRFPVPPYLECITYLDPEMADCQSGQFGDYELHRTARPFLPNRRLIGDWTNRGDILDFEAVDITASELAIDRQIEER